MNHLNQLFEELKRRNIYKVAVVYGITGWVIVQVASIASSSFGAPGWVMKMLITVVLLGFPIAIILAWAFEITPDGIKRTKEIPKPDSIAPQTGKKLNYWIICLLSAGVLFLLADKFWLEDSFAASEVDQAGIEVPSVAVLPFEDFSKEGNQEWFADGLTEEILNSLARLQGLKVAARTSSFYFKDKNIPIMQIADTLGVKHIVEGSVRRIGDDMRITAQLIRAEDGFHLWSKTYKRKVDDVFKVQEDISENIASALDIYLDEQKRQKMFAFGTRNVGAYEAYLKGRNIYDEIHLPTSSVPLNEISIELFEEANIWFEKAIRLDPDFAAPYYYHSDAYLHYLMHYSEFRIDSLSIEEAKGRMLADFENAIKHAENSGQKVMFGLEKTFLSDNWSQLPLLLQQLKNSPEAQKAFATLGGGWSRTLLNAIGYGRLQHRLSKKILQFDPLNSGLKISVIQGLLNFASADSIIKVINSSPVLKNFPAELLKAQFFVYLADNQFEKADSIAYLAANKGFKSYNLILQAIQGEKEEAIKNFRNLSSQNFTNPFALAFVHYALGNTEKANNLVQKINNAPMGSISLMRDIVISGGLLGFDLATLPTLAEKFKEAGVEVKPIQIGQVTLPRIVQKEL